MTLNDVGCTVTVEGLEPGQLLEVLANIDQGTKRWRRKVRLIAVVGRWGDTHEVGVRELAQRTTTGLELVRLLLGELVAARVLLVQWPGEGSRAGAYVVNPALEQWGTDHRGRQVAGGVPWCQPVPSVRLFAFHVEHEQYEEPRQRAAYRPPAARNAQQRAAGGTRAARRSEQRAAGDPRTARKDRTARGIRAQNRALIAQLAQEGSPPVGSPLAPPPSAGAPGGGDGAETAEWRQVLAAVKVAAKAPFIEGRPKAELLELYREVGADQILEWLPGAPVGHKVPRLVDWLTEQRHQPPAELLERLAERDEAPVEPAEEPPAPPAPWTGHAYDDAPSDPVAATEVRRAAREALKSSPSDPEAVRLSTTPGGA